MDMNVVFRPLSARFFTKNIDEKRQDEIFIEPANAADNDFPFFHDKTPS